MGPNHVRFDDSDDTEEADGQPGADTRAPQAITPTPVASATVAAVATREGTQEKNGGPGTSTPSRGAPMHAWSACRTPTRGGSSRPNPNGE